MGYQDLTPQEQSSRRFHLETDKGAAWRQGQILAAYIEGLFSDCGYHGPVAIAGGYMRDLALHRTPKDLDVFIDQGSMLLAKDAERLAGRLVEYLGNGLRVKQTLPCYGNWAKDLEKVVKLEGQDSEVTEAVFYLGGIPFPYSVDLIVLSTAEMQKCGYLPATHQTHGSRASFLRAVLARVDLRLNALGATATGTDSAAQWNEDALNERLVVQHSRLEEADGEITGRILARITRQTAEGAKYAGWEVCLEGADGSLLVD